MCMEEQLGATAHGNINGEKFEHWLWSLADSLPIVWADNSSTDALEHDRHLGGRL